MAQPKLNNLKPQELSVALPQGSQQHAGYRPEIDGLRAIAVSAVLCFHAGWIYPSTGFVGVDVFFVISGFLISRIIIEEIKSGDFTFQAFYERRARRLAPAFFFVVLVTLLAGFFVFPPSDYKYLAESSIAATFFISNVYFWLDIDYFSTTAELKPLLHTWSLSIEEQFYFVFPVCLIILHYFKLNILWFCASITTLSLALAIVATPHSPSAAFYLFPTRMWELGLGAVCAALSHNSMRWLTRYKEMLSVLGILMIVVPMFLYDDTTRSPVPLLLVPTLGTALVLLFGRGTAVAVLLSLPAFVGIGQISYSLYLWHQPVFSFARMLSVGELPFITTLALIGLSGLLAYFTWRFVESPFRGKQPVLLPRSKGFFMVLGGGVGAVTVLSAFVMTTEGFKHRFDPEVLQKVEMAADLTQIKACTANLQAQSAVSCSIGSVASGSPVLVVFGDSHASQWLHALDIVGKNKGWRIELFAKTACPSVSVNFVAPELKRLYHECGQWRASAITQIAALNPFAVVLANSSIGYLRHLGTTNISPDEWRDGAAKTVEQLQPHTKKIAVLVDNPQFRSFDPRLCVTRALLMGTLDLNRCTLPRQIALDQSASDEEASIDGTHIIDISDEFCDEAQCYLYHNGHIVMRDSNHVSRPYSESLADKLEHSLSVIIN